MKVADIGGAEFIGRRIVEMLTARGDDVLVAHRCAVSSVRWHLAHPPASSSADLHADDRAPA